MYCSRETALGNECASVDTVCDDSFLPHSESAGTIRIFHSSPHSHPYNSSPSCLMNDDSYDDSNDDCSMHCDRCNQCRRDRYCSTRCRQNSMRRGNEKAEKRKRQRRKKSRLNVVVDYSYCCYYSSFPSSLCCCSASWSLNEGGMSCMRLFDRCC